MELPQIQGLEHLENYDITTYQDLVQGVIDGHVKYKEFVQFYPGNISAAVFYGDIVSKLYDSEKTVDATKCENCEDPGSHVVIFWYGLAAKSKLHYWITQWGHFLKIFLIICLPVFIVSKKDFFFGARKLNFTTHHKLCENCRPSKFRDFLAFLYRMLSSIAFACAGIAFIIFGTIILNKLSETHKSASENWPLIVSCFAGSCLVLLFILSGLSKRVELAIALPFHLRKLAFGPFDTYSYKISK